MPPYSCNRGGGGGGVAALDANAECTISGPDEDGIRTNTCTGENTGRQQARGVNAEEKLILQNGASITSTGGQGILARGDAATTRVTIETAGDITAATGIQFDMGRPGPTSDGLSTLSITGGTISATGNGVSFNSRALGGFTFEMPGGTIGTSNARVGGSGLSAGIQGRTSVNAIDIDSDSSIYATARGMSLTHAGSGKIDIDLTSGSIIDTMGSGNRGAGIWIARSGSGAIEITNAGTIRSAGHDGVFALNAADGAVMIDHQSGGAIEAANNGIYVRHGDANAGGNGAISITSGGDITSAGATGIFLDLNRGSETAADQTRVDLTGGTVRAANSGIQVNSRTQGGLAFGIEDGASLGAADAVIGFNGASLSLTNSANANALDVDSDGTIHARYRGLSLAHSGSGAIDIDLTQNSRIETQESLVTFGTRTLTRGAGVFAYHDGSGAISIDHEGIINAGLGTGISAIHAGTGNLDIINSGMITAGFQGIDARRFPSATGQLHITHSGSITASSGPGILARSDGGRTSETYDLSVTIKGDVTTTSPNQAAVRAEATGATGNAGILIDHNAGTITGHLGIVALARRFSGSTYSGEIPADLRPTGYPSSGQPVVRVEVGGGEKTARIVARALPGRGDFAADETAHQVGWVSRILAGTYDLPAGINLGAADYQKVGHDIAAGDKEETGITAEIRTQFRSVYGAAQTYSGTVTGLPALDPRELVEGFEGDLASDADIDAYLMGDRLIRFREFTLTAEENAVLEAAFGRGDLEAALGALPASYTDDYKNTARWYAGAYNNADLRVAVYDNGVIDSEQDGIRVSRRYPRDENTGTSSVFIDEGARVIAARYGVRMLGAGVDENAHIPEGPTASLRKQIVEVRGHLESTGPDGAAIALRGGGRVIVGANTTLLSASGTTIKIDEADAGTNLIIELQMQEGEDLAGTFRRALPGRVVNDGTTRTWVEDDGNYSLVPVRAEPRDTPPENPAERMLQGPFDAWMDCILDGSGCQTSTVLAPRARVYEALPSVLLDMNDVSGRDLCGGIRRDGNGAWAGIFAATEDWDLSDSTANTSYDAERIGVVFGADRQIEGNGVLSVFLHHQSGSADVENAGEIDGQATGAGVAYRHDVDPLTIGLRASGTYFKNDLESALRGHLASNVSGIGYAVGVDAGYEIALSNSVLSLEAGLTHSAVKMDDFNSVLKDPNALSGLATARIADVEGKETTLHARAAYEWPFDSGDFFIGAGLDTPLDSSAEVRVDNTHLPSEKRSSASLHGGIALDGVGGESSTVLLSLGYTKQSGGEGIRMNLIYRF